MIKIFGIERSFTHYLRELLVVNFNELPCQNLFGDTHGRISLEGWLQKNEPYRTWVKNNSCNFVICVKNPYTWTYSMLRFFEVMHIYRHIGIEKHLKRYNKTYLDWHESLIDNNHPFFNNGIVIKYENLLQYPMQELSVICEIDTFKQVEKVELSDAFSDKRMEWYLNPDIEPETINLVNRFVSDEFFKKYDYEKL